MTWLYWIVLLFSALTLYFVGAEYRQERFSKRAFVLVGIMETIVLIITVILLMGSL